ncbi:MAG: hypothetical protein WD029_08000 [Microthrixaceae bacterium]
MHRPSSHQLSDLNSASDYIELISLQEEFMLYGFEPNSEFLTVHAAPLPEDSRTPAAGLFGITLPESWKAVGTILGGSATRSGTKELLSADAQVRVVVTRSGETCTQLFIDGNMLTPPPRGSSVEPWIADFAPQDLQPAHGIVTDCLHRMLGLPTPGGTPSLEELVVGLWLNQVTQAAMNIEGLTWEQAVALHPGEPADLNESGQLSVTPSLETITEATFRAAEELDWGRMRRRAIRGEFQATALDPEEAEWMDTTMFARWVAGSIPDSETLIRTVERLGAKQVSENISAVLRAIQDGKVNIE